MGKIKYSIISPAIRGGNAYKKFYDYINYNNHTSYEIVFVGHVPPKEAMPSNFRYIFTEIRNAAQCIEIAARAAVGDYLSVMPDDVMVSEGFLDKMDFYISRMDKVVVVSRVQVNGVFQDNDFIFNPHITNSPIIGPTCFFKKSMWHELGGIDRRFSYAYFDIDMMYRCYEKGYTVFIAPNCWFDEKKEVDERGMVVDNTLLSKTRERCGYLINKLWFKDGVFTNKRLQGVLPFSDKNLLTSDQMETNVDFYCCPTDLKSNNDILCIPRFYSSCYVSQSYDYSIHKNISFILPYRGEASILLDVAINIFSLATHPERIEFLVRIDDDQEDLYNFLKQNSIINQYSIKIYSGERYGVENLHKYQNELSRLSIGDVIVIYTDEISLLDIGWDDEFIPYLNTLSVICFKQYMQEGDKVYEYLYACFLPIITRRLYDVIGRISPCSFTDLYINAMAENAGIKVKLDSRMCLKNRDQDQYDDRKKTLDKIRQDDFNSNAIKNELDKDTNLVIDFLRKNNLYTKKLPEVVFGFGLYRAWFGKSDCHDSPTVEIVGGEDKEYLVQFINKNTNIVLYSASMQPYNTACCNYDLSIPHFPLLVKVSSPEDGVFYEKEIEVINYIQDNNEIESKKRIKEIMVSFINGAKIEIIGEGEDTYILDFIDHDYRSMVHKEISKLNRWSKPLQTYYTNWLLRVKHNKRILFEYQFNLTGKKCFVSFTSQSKEDTLAWIPYVDKFRVKHNCDVFLSTYWNHLIKQRYEHLCFVDPGEPVGNIYAQYDIGRWESNYNNPNGWKDIPIGKICSDILGVEYER